MAKNAFFEFQFGGASGDRSPVDPQTPFRIALLGDFAGRRDEAPSAPRRRRVDIDCFEDTMRRFTPAVALPATKAGEQPEVLSFSSLEDFDPERLLRDVPELRSLVDLRTRLTAPGTFAAAAAELQTRLGGQVAPPDDADSAPQDAQPESTADLLSRLMGKDAPSPEPRSEVSGIVDQLLRSAAAGNAVPAPDQRQSVCLQQADELLSSGLRAILHAPEFQALEAAWRSVDLLVSGLEMEDPPIELHLFDVPRAQLPALLTGEELRDSGLYRLLAGSESGVLGGQPWAVIAGLYALDGTGEDCRLLTGLSGLARTMGAPFLGAADPALLGRASMATARLDELWEPPKAAEMPDSWQQWRQTPAAANVCLALPGFLLRLPYGRRGERIHAFDFEELTPPEHHTQLLWGNPAAACAYLLAAGYQQAGWQAIPGTVTSLEDLPLCVVEEAGERVMHPTAQAWISENGADFLEAQGLTVLLSVKNENRVQVRRLLSCSDPAAGLPGRWD